MVADVRRQAHGVGARMERRVLGVGVGDAGG